MKSALVLGGGGITGIAWEIGVVKGLREGGIDLGTADLIVGTSAGSVVGALIAGGVDLDELVAKQRAPDAASRELGADFDPEQLVMAIAALMQGAQGPQDLRARIGAMAVAAETPGEAERLAVIASRVPLHDWPARQLLITGVDASSGEFVVWDRESLFILLIRFGYCSF